MASTSESGHAKNVSNFRQLVSEVNGMGGDYNPSNADLTLTALDTRHEDAKNAQKLVNSKNAATKGAVNKRVQMFDDILGPLVTKCLNALEASGADDDIVRDARGIGKKITGHSGISQQSFDMRLDNFDLFVEILKTEPKYAPNETEIQTASLETFYSDMVSANQAVILANREVGSARGARNRQFYSDGGLIDVALDVKKYVRSVYGSNDSRFTRVNGIEFKRYED